MTTARSIVALVALAALAACSDDGGSLDGGGTTEATAPAPQPTAAAGETTTTAVESSTTTTLPAIARQPLTGVPVDGVADVIDRPALAVKIDNHPVARREHSGLAVADIVYEELVEGRLTRFLAVFHANDSDPVGPIRSGRSQDVALLAPLNLPLFAWSGGNPGVTSLISESPVIDLNATRTPGYYRGPGPSPHDLYSDTTTLFAMTPEGHPGAPSQQFQFLQPGEVFAGDPVAQVSLSFGAVDVAWDWDVESGVWLRSQGGLPHLDKTHGSIAFTNVVVMVVEYGQSTIDATSPEARTVGDGPAFVFSGGHLVEGRWARASAEDPIAFVDADGQPIRLTPGNTWIELAEGVDAGDPSNPDAPMSILPGV